MSQASGFGLKQSTPRQVNLDDTIPATAPKFASSAAELPSRSSRAGSVMSLMKDKDKDKDKGKDKDKDKDKDKEKDKEKDKKADKDKKAEKEKKEKKEKKDKKDKEGKPSKSPKNTPALKPETPNASPSVLTPASTSRATPTTKGLADEIKLPAAAGESAPGSLSYHLQHHVGPGTPTRNSPRRTSLSPRGGGHDGYAPFPYYREPSLRRRTADSEHYRRMRMANSEALYSPLPDHTPAAGYRGRSPAPADPLRSPYHHHTPSPPRYSGPGGGYNRTPIPVGNGNPPVPPGLSEVFVIEWAPHIEPQIIEVTRGGGGVQACAILHLSGVRHTIIPAEALLDVTVGGSMWMSLKCKNGVSFKIRPRSAADFGPLAESLGTLQSVGDLTNASPLRALRHATSPSPDRSVLSGSPVYHRGQQSLLQTLWYAVKLIMLTILFAVGFFQVSQEAYSWLTSPVVHVVPLGDGDVMTVAEALFNTSQLSSCRLRHDYGDCTLLLLDCGNGYSCNYDKQLINQYAILSNASGPAVVGLLGPAAAASLRDPFLTNLGSLATLSADADGVCTFFTYALAWRENARNCRSQVL
ncbi:hypothetical protein DIPPA_30633 [Diplonema papillatum]|nr:hypothetical protein DIPPA_30633 [Diplonema papillatum]